ncbi:conserved hypothetical protein [Ricinus communis]|uniref:Uncharacterized protein n=1 Tax=Ricinus communis TaxID=3988 RepID=B9RWY9_RICCO|nr:conserved hypothetical protein [Ricinus communis]
MTVPRNSTILRATIVVDPAEPTQRFLYFYEKLYGTYDRIKEKARIAIPSMFSTIEFGLRGQTGGFYEEGGTKEARELVKKGGKRMQYLPQINLNPHPTTVAFGTARKRSTGQSTESTKSNKDSFWARQERNSPFDTKRQELIAGDDLVKGIYERSAGTRWKRQRREQPNGRAYLKEHQSPPSVRYADGEYAAEQPQGLPAVIAELTRWALRRK